MTKTTRTSCYRDLRNSGLSRTGAVLYSLVWYVFEPVNIVLTSYLDWEARRSTRRTKR
jgi:hypothetical protein